MKILFMGDASGYHATLARELARRGHEVTVASNGSRWMDTARTVDLTRRPGKLGGALLWARLSTVLASKLKGYDIVQLVNPIFVELKPGRVGRLFQRLKRDNGRVMLTALGTDSRFIRGCIAPDSPLAYSEWAIDGRPTEFSTGQRGGHLAKWLDEPLSSFAEMIYDEVDGVITVLYEYHRILEQTVDASKLAYGGIPIETSGLPFMPPKPSDPVEVLMPYHPGREGEKGIDIIGRTVSQIPGMRVTPITGLKYIDFIQRLKEADVVLDQLYSYTPATTALMAMSMGKTVVTGGEADFARWIGEPSIPVVNPDPRNPEKLIDDLRRAVAPGVMAQTAVAARDFVVRHNDVAVVADRFENFWNR